MTSFSNPESGKVIDTQKKGGITFKVKQFGEGKNAYFRLLADGGQVGNYNDKKSALGGVDDYLSSLRTRNKKQVFKK